MLKPLVDISIVRLAEPEDEHDLLMMVRDMHHESPLRNAQGQPLFFSDAKARSIVRNAICRDEAGRNSWVGIIGDRGQLEGSVCLSIIEPSPFSHEQFIDSSWNYVRATYRTTAVNTKTLQAFAERVSDRLGIPLLIKAMGNHAGRKSFYERSCQPFGGIFVYSSQHDSLGAGA